MRKICRSGGPVHHCHWQTWWRWGYCYHSQQCLSLQLAGGFVARFSCSSCCNLGEFDLSEKILKENAEMSEHCKAVVQAKQHVAQGYPKELVAEALIGGWRGWDKNIVGEWVSDSLEIFKSPEKGLGVRTKCQVLGGATLIVQRPRASADANAEKDKEILTSLNTTARLVDNASKVKLAAQISSAASKDMLLARTVSCLDDGLGKDRQVVGFNILLDQLQPVVLPFLLQQPEFFPEKERLEISHASVQGVVSVNCHGSNSKSTFESSGTSLYPAISLINHSSSPNCALIPITPSGAKNNRASGEPRGCTSGLDGRSQSRSTSRNWVDTLLYRRCGCRKKKVEDLWVGNSRSKKGFDDLFRVKKRHDPMPCISLQLLIGYFLSLEWSQGSWKSRSDGVFALALHGQFGER